MKGSGKQVMVVSCRRLHYYCYCCDSLKDSMKVFNLMYFAGGLLKTHLHFKIKVQNISKIRIQKHR